MKKIIKYKVRNWPQYNQALINRGNLAIWVSEDAMSYPDTIKITVLRETKAVGVAK